MAKIGLIGRVSNATEQFILSRVKNGSLLNEYYKRKDKPGAPWKRQAVQVQKKEITDMVNAIMAATDPENPRRGDLMRFYASLNTDLHLGSCVEQRILPVQCANYNLNDDKGIPDDEAKKLLDKPWFLDLIRLVVKSTFEGTTLIELFKLNTKMEIEEVVEIPQSNFIAHQGIIIEEEYDEKGVSYKEGFWSNYYIQVGNNWNLGLYSQIGSTIIAKKLSLGSWLSYIDKFGVPPVFAITDRMDDSRLDELYEMLSQYRQNMFAILQGNEKIEVPNNFNVDAYQSFLKHGELMDSQVSKFILGGTGTTDEKNFVGSAEVHERMLKTRTMVDKMLFKFYFNEEIKPRLVNLSEVYAPLANLTFEFDETETLTLKEKLDVVKALASYYEFNIEELAKITGLPITAVKQAVSTTNTEEDDAQKKKLNAKGLNTPQAKGSNRTLSVAEVFAATWDAAIERLANDIYEGNVKTTDLDKDLVLKNYSAFNKTAEQAWGKGYYDESITRQFRENLLQFSGAKSHDLMKHLDDLKAGSKSKESFITQAKAIVNKHNKTYLKTEKRFCDSAVHSAQDYQTYQNDVDIYPNLKYRTMGDEDVRESHAANEGIVKPVGEWRALPPYKEGCRCWLEQTTEEPTSGRCLKGIKFNNNPIKTGNVFNQEHSYFENIASNDKGKVRDNTERMKSFTPYNKTIKEGDNTIHVNDFHDLADGEANIEVSKVIASALDKDVFVLPHIQNSDKLNVKNPELGIGTKSHLADLKTLNAENQKDTRKFIANNIKSANKQGCKTVVFDLSQAPEEDYLIKAADKLRGELKGDSKANIKRIIIIRESEAIEVTRKQLNQKNYREYFTFE